MIRAFLILVAVYAICADAAYGQATQPAARDRMLYIPADPALPPVELVPEDLRWPPVNLPVYGVAIDRSGDDDFTGRWKPATRPVSAEPPPATQPGDGSQPPLVIEPDGPPNPPPPPPPPADVLVKPGQSWVAGVLSAKAGQTVEIVAGDYFESWKDTSKRPAAGVTIRGAGIGKTRLIATGGDHVLAWTWSNVSFAGVSFIGTDRPSGHGLRILGGSNLTFTDCEATKFRMAVCIEAASGKRSKDIRFLGGNYSDNWHSDNGHSSAFYVDRCDGLQVVGATVARNGHNPAAGSLGTGENHGGYVTGECGPAVVTDCTIEDNSSHGWQARSGGTFERNVCRRNPIHLSFGLVNGLGPIHLGGVSGTIAGNWFERSRLIAGTTPRGYCIEIANVGGAGVVIRDNEAFSDDPQPDPRIVPSFAWLRVDRCNLHSTNPHNGKDAGVQRLAVENNAVTWAGPKVYVGPGLGGDWKLQSTWPASDGVRGAAK